jgi:hypothetical protein
MNDWETTLCYVGYCPSCGLIQGAAVQTKGREKETAKFIAPWIRAGERIATITVAEVRAAKWCECSKRLKPVVSEPTPQTDQAETSVRPKNENSTPSPKDSGEDQANRTK